jgi:hypothetical protein
MCYTNKINYPKDYLFSIKELAPIMPEMIYQYFMFIRAYGRENASDDIPTGAMSATLLGVEEEDLLVHDEQPCSMGRPRKPHQFLCRE